jgi:S-adenosylmethionine decarboxylase
MSFGDALHLKINMAGCNKDLLASVEKVKEYLDTTPGFINMTLIKESDPLVWEDENPEYSGVTGVSILATSHVSAHTFPNKGFAYIDIFSCSNFSIQDALSMTLDFFDPIAYKHWVTDRSDLFNWDYEN